MKKRRRLLALLPLVFFIVGCGKSNKKIQTTEKIDTTEVNPLQEDERYEIYLLAKQAGFSGTYEEWLDSIRGEDGRGIVKIIKTSSDGLIDTYTITYTDNTTQTFTITNGSNSSSSNDGEYSISEYYDDNYNTMGRIISKIDGKRVEIISQLFYGEYVNRNKVVKQFDNNYNAVLTEEYRWSTDSNSWYGRYKEEYNYDSTGREIMCAEYEWSSNLNNWVGNHKREYTYDADYQILSIAYVWSNNEWTGSTKTVYEYNTNGEKTLEVFYNWSIDSNNWIGNTKRIYAYEIGQRTYEYYNWSTNTNSWVGQEKTVYEYDTSGRQNLSITYAWSLQDNDWQESQKSELEYDSNGRKILDNKYSWDINKNEWFAYEKSSYVYNIWDNGYVEQVKSYFEAYSWNQSSNRYVGVEKYVKAYDENGNQLLNEVYNWSNSLNSWVGFLKEEYEYEKNGNNYYQNKLIKYAWIQQTENWYVSEKINYRIVPTGETSWSSMATMYEKYTYDIGTNSTVGFEKYDRDFNDNGDVILKINYKWNLDNNLWEYTDKYEYDYDPRFENGLWDNARILDSHYIWSATKDSWIGDYKKVKELNVFGETTCQISYAWSDNSNEWIENEKTESVTVNNVSFHNVYHWHKNNWTLYSSNGYIIINSKSYEVWDEQYYYSDLINDYYGMQFIMREYDDAGRLTKYERPQWDYNLCGWINDEKIENTYGNNMSVQICYTWDKEGEKWDYDSKTEYAYDSSGSLLSTTEYKWNSTTNEWDLK